MEAGVWRGGTTILMRAILHLYSDKQRKVWVADSFEGCPRPREEAERGDRHWQNPFIAVNLETVQENFRRYGLLDDQVCFLRGWFCDTLPNAPVERLAVLRVDGDMYSSTMDVLRAMYHRISPGGYVIIDDYYTIDICRKAGMTFAPNKGSPPQFSLWIFAERFGKCRYRRDLAFEFFLTARLDKYSRCCFMVLRAGAHSIPAGLGLSRSTTS